MSGSFRTNQILILMFKIVISILAITISFSLSAGVPDQEKLDNTKLMEQCEVGQPLD